MDAKDPFFDEEKKPHHSHMFDRKYFEVIECLVQDEATSVEA